MIGVIKKTILWNYERGTWPYDLLCLLIIAFIFLTPNEWFKKSEITATKSIVVVVKASELDKEDIKSGLSSITGYKDFEIKSIKETEGGEGREYLEIEIEQSVQSK